MRLPPAPASAHALRVLRGKASQLSDSESAWHRRAVCAKDPSVNLLLRLEARKVLPALSLHEHSACSLLIERFCQETPTFAARTSAVLDRTFLEGVAPVRPVAGAEQSRVNLASIALVSWQPVFSDDCSSLISELASHQLLPCLQECRSLAKARMDGRSAFPLPRARARRPTAPSLT